MFLDYKDITSREAYEYYRENRKNTCKSIDQYNYFKKAVNGLFSVIEEMLVNNEHGVCIRGFGYLCAVRRVKKIRANTVKETSILKKYKRRYSYKPYYFPDVMFEEWNMNSSFNRKVQVKINKSDNKYKLHKTVCDSIIVAEDFSLVSKHNKAKNPQRDKNYKKESRK